MKLSDLKTLIRETINEELGLKLKRVGPGIYYEPLTKKWISGSRGGIAVVWNIWNNEDLTDEFAGGFNYLDAAKRYLEKSIKA